MVQIKEDKSKLKNWEIGDTFAIKIENTDTEYDGQYIILIKCEKEEHLRYCPRKTNQPYFYAKVTKNKSIPKDLNELNSLDFIKINWCSWNHRFFPHNGLETLSEAEKRVKNIEFYPDEYKYLFSYIIQIWFKKIKKINFQYIGKYDINTPKEFISIMPPLMIYESENELTKKFLGLYNDYNLRKGYLYTEEGIKEIRKRDEEELQLMKNEEKYINEYRKTGKFPSKEKIQEDLDRMVSDN